MVIVKAKLKAVVDASFWIHLVKLNLVEEFIKLWAVVVTKKVELELFTFARIKLYTPLDLDIYNDLKSKEIIKIKDPKSIPKDINSQITNHSGELYSIALAKEENLIESDFLRKLIEKRLKENRLGMALRAYEKKEVNIAGGAKIAGITYRAFLDALEENGIPTMEISHDTIKYGFESMERSLGLKPKKRDYNKLYEDILIKKGKKK
jgi:predicted HTH domain antitoxin